ncbi:GNAT family N-acetyltransferase [uncultured Sulfitobacter sp.]|uniref:GNAT family N-acetyltransferase n=1 Tax=uncultured Sulfitobacter sp. TaxID=191468 RepID=UPI0026232B4E|nr:GNAT family N-acetyltransferase [uncultured Sulfitobacter sp.]
MASHLPFRAVLRNSEIVLVREVVPDDRKSMREGFEKLSKQSRFFRFLAPHRHLSEAELDRFTEANTDEHFAIGAASIGVEANMPLATARFVRVAKGSEEAEFAITIIDSHQRLGLGSLLLRTLAREAQRRGIQRFTALVHHDNAGIQALMKRFGGYRQSGGVAEQWVLPLPLTPAPTLSIQPNEIAIWPKRS